MVIIDYTVDNPATGQAIVMPAREGRVRVGRMLLNWTEGGVLLSAPYEFAEPGHPDRAVVFALARAADARVEAPLLDEPSVLHEDGGTSPLDRP